MKDLGIIQIAWKLKRKASKAGKNLYSRAHYHLIVEKQSIVRSDFDIEGLAKIILICLLKIDSLSRH